MGTPEILTAKIVVKKLETGTVIPKLVEKEHDYGANGFLIRLQRAKNTGQGTESARTAEIEEVDVLDKVDHSWELVSTTPATCTIGEIQHYKVQRLWRDKRCDIK